MFSSLPAKRSISQEGWHNWHFTGFTLAEFCHLGLTIGIYGLPQHTMLPPTLLVIFMLPVTSRKASGKLQQMKVHLLYSLGSTMLYTVWEQGWILDQISPEEGTP